MSIFDYRGFTNRPSRIGLTYEAEAENITQEDVINRILDTVEVP